MNPYRTDSVRCPRCHAKPGEPCKTPTGVVRWDYPHKARQRTAIAAGVRVGT